MDRKSLTFSAVLVASITLSLIPITAQRKGAPLRKKPVEQSNDAKNRQAIADQDRERNLRAIADELKAIREQAAKAEQPHTQQKQSWWTDGGPPIWSNWILAIIAGVAGYVAWRAFSHQRDAVRLTERADVLVASMGIEPVPTPHLYKGMTIYALPLNAQVVVYFKNSGPTRASNVDWGVEPIIEGVPAKKPDSPPEPATVVIAANDDIHATTGPLNAYYADAVVASVGSGNTKLRIKMSVSYDDVFGKRHSTTQYARYFNGTFRFEEKMEAD
jgi:hypothetical protein